MPAFPFTTARSAFDHDHRPAAVAVAPRAARSTRAMVAALAALAAIAGGGVSNPPVGAQAAGDAIELVALTLGSDDVFGQAAAGTAIGVELVGRDGTLRGSTSTTVGFFGLFIDSFSDADGRAVAAFAGDTARLLEGGALVQETEIPALTIEGDAATDTVSGGAPAGSTLVVSASSGLGFDAVERVVTADEGGRFAASFAGDFDIGPDTTIAATWSSERLEVTVERPLTPNVALRLYDDALVGLARNGARVEATLAGPDGTVRAAGGADAIFLGRFLVSLSDPAGEPATIRPGDRLTLVGLDDVATRFDVPELTAEPDIDADAVTGLAPAGARVRVTIGGDAVETAAGADGVYVASFAGTADLQAGTTGQVETSLMVGAVRVDVRRAWGVTRLSIAIGEAEVEGVASVGEPVLLTLRRGAEGRAHATSIAEVTSGGIFGGGGTFVAELVDLEDAQAPVLPFDTLEYRRGPEAIDIPIPLLSARVDAEADTVDGEAPPGATVTVQAQRFFTLRTIETVAGADGRYAASFAGEMDLVGGTGVVVSIELPGGHSLSFATAAATLELEPEMARLGAVVTPLTALSVRVDGPDGRRRASAEGSTNILGGATLALRDGDDPYYPEPGDVVRVLFGATTRELVVPGLAFDWDTDDERVFGETLPGGTIEAIARPPAGQGAGTVSRLVAVPPSGAWSVEFAGEADLRAASRLRISYIFDSGDRVRIDRVLPFVDAQVGGAALSGFALPRARVEASAVAGGAPVAADTVDARDDHGFAAVLRTGGRPHRVDSDEHIRLDYSGQRIDVPVEHPLSVRLSPSAGSAGATASGEGPPSGAVSLQAQAVDGPARTLVVETDASGAWRAELPAELPLAPGLRAEVSRFDADGHRFHALTAEPRLTAYVGTPRIRGVGDPLAEVRLGAGAAPPATIAAADTWGAFDGEIPSASLVAGTIVSGEVGGRPVSMTVADVHVAVAAAANRITGRFPVGDGLFGRFGSVDVYPRDGGAPTSYVVLADEDGAFDLVTNPPPFLAPAFDLRDAERVELAYTGADGHETVAVGRVAIEVYLPIVRR